MGYRVPRGSDEPRRKRVQPATDPAAEPTTASQFETMFSLLSSRRRRYLLYSLVDMEGSVVERSQLVAWLAAAEHGLDADDSLETQIETDLHHNQLPRLEAAGIVDYDPRQGTIRYDGLPFSAEWLEHACYRETGRLL